MADFDPYLEWLEIPTAEQPPTHYRILGVIEFCTDLDEIKMNTELMTMALQSHVGGPHSDDALKLQKEIAAARDCLVNREPKAEYDEQLIKAKFLGTSGSGSTATPADQSAAQIAAVETPTAEESPTAKPTVEEPAKQSESAKSADSKTPSSTSAKFNASQTEATVSAAAKKPIADSDADVPESILDAAFDDDDFSADEPATSSLDSKSDAKRSLAAKSKSSSKKPSKESAKQQKRESPKKSRESRTADSPSDPPMFPRSQKSKELPQLARESSWSEEPTPFNKKPLVLFASALGIVGLLGIGWMVVRGMGRSTPTPNLAPPDPGMVAQVNTPLSKRKAIRKGSTKTKSGNAADKKVKDDTEIDTPSVTQNSTTPKSQTPPTTRQAADAALSGSGRPTTTANTKPIPTTNTVPVSNAVNLIEKIDLTRDARSGKWSISQGGLATPATERALLEIAYTVPRAYELTVETQLILGEAAVYVVLPVMDSHVLLAIDGWKGTASGLQLIDGESGDQNETAFYGRVLQFGKPNIIACKVAPGRIQVSCNGRILMDWAGDPGRLSLPEGISPPKTGHLALIAGAVSYRIAALRLAPLAGAGSGENPVAGNSKRLAVPVANDLKAAELAVKDLFESNLASAKTPDAQLQLAEEFLKQGSDTNNDTASRYSLLRMASDLAAAAGDLDTALRAIDQMGQTFRIDVAARKQQLLQKARTTARSVEANQKLTQLAMTAIGEAIDANNLDAAISLCATASAVARKANEAKVLVKIGSLRKQISGLRTAKQKAIDAAEKLKADPDDHDANFARGVYLCLSKGQWRSGLIALTKAGDSKLRQLAEHDLADPLDPMEQAKLADDWWNWIASNKKKDVSQFKIIPHYWYTQALPKLTALTKVKVEKRLEEIGELARIRTTSGTNRTALSTTLPPRPPSSVAEEIQLNRRAAELAFRFGAMLTVVLPNGQSTSRIRKASELPIAFAITQLDFTKNQAIRDLDFTNLQGLRFLKELNLSGTPVTGSGLQNIKASAELSVLNLSNAQKFTDAGLEHIGALKKLTTLNLSETAITDAGLENLAGLKELTQLTLTGTNISETALPHLEKLVQLRVLNVQDTKLTADAVETLKKSLVNCQVIQ